MRTTVLVIHPGAELYGSDRMVAETVEGLVAAGRRVRVVLPTTGPLTARLVAAGAQVRTIGVPVLRRSALTPYGLVALLSAVVRTAPAALRLMRSSKADVVYVSTVTQPWWLVLARLAGVPAVCHVHEAEASVPRAVRIGLAAPLLLARRVILNSQFARDVAVGAVPVLRSRCVVVLNGVRGPARPLSPAVELERPGGRLRLLYVGRLSHRKGPDVLVEAAARLLDEGVDVELTLLGGVFPGGEPYEEHLHRQVSDGPLAGRVRFAGFVDDVWAEAEQHHVWVVPSRTDEPFGNTAVEALLAGRPLVVTRCGGLAEAADGYASAVLCRPDDPADLAAAVARVSRHWQEVARATASDAARAAERHAPDHYRAQLLDVLDAAT